MPGSTKRIITVMNEHCIPIFEMPEEAVRAFEVSLLQHMISLKK